MKKEINLLTAKLDALMLELCPDEMSQEQIETFEKHQVVAKEDTELPTSPLGGMYHGRATGRGV